MKIFLDNANLGLIEEALKRGFIRGITTNPAIISSEKKRPLEEHINDIITLMHRYERSDFHLSVEVFSRETKTIIEQAEHFGTVFARHRKNLSIKVQVGWDELEAIVELKKRDFTVNCTCCMTVSQAIMAAAAGADIVSLFWGRIRDGGDHSKHGGEIQKGLEAGTFAKEDFDPAEVVRKTRKLLDMSYPKVEIIAGSIRSVNDVVAAGLAGAHIVTVPPKFFIPMASHFKTDEVIQQFFDTFKAWNES